MFGFLPWCSRRRAILESEIPEKELHMPGIWFVDQAVLFKLEESIKDPHLFCIAVTTADSAFGFELNIFP